MIFLSNFAKSGKDSRAISIAAITPKWYNGATRKDLAPSLSLLKKYKTGSITPMQYMCAYANIIYSFDLDKLVKELDNHVLLCYCKKSELCHRLILGSYLKIETGVEIEEIGGFDDKWHGINDKDQFIELILSDEEKDKYNLHGKFENDNIVGHWRELKKLGLTSLFTSGDIK